MSVGAGTFVINGVGITQTGVGITVPGAATFNSGAGVITLTTAGNDFQDSVSLNNSGVNAVQVTDTNAIEFGASSVGTDTLTVISGGAITQSGAIVQGAGAGIASFTTGGFAVTLTNGSNDFTGQ